MNEIDPIDERLRPRGRHEILARVRLRTMPRRLVTLLAIAAVGGVAIELASGAPTPAEPISIEAEHLDVDVSSGAATLAGSVTLRRGDLVVTCTKAEAKFDREARVVWAHGEGPVVAIFRDIRAEARELELDAPHQRLELRGGVRVHRPGADLTAATAVFDGTTGRVQLSGVKAVLSAAPSALFSAAPAPLVSAPSP